MTCNATNEFSKLALSPVPTSVVVDVIAFAMFISIATTALVAVVADRRQARHLMGAVLERHSAYAWERTCVRHFWGAIVYDFIEIAVDGSVRRTRTTFDAVGPLHLHIV